MIHNQLAHGAELQNGIAAAVGLPRELDGVVRLSESLEATIDPWSQPEWAFLRGERLGTIPGFVAAVVAEFSIIALGNPAGSGNIVVVENVNCFSTASMNLEVVADSVVAGTLGAAAAVVSGRDRRWGSAVGRTFLKIGTDLANTFGVILDKTVPPVNQYAPFPNGVPCVLKPGDDLIVIAQTVNVAMNANFKFRERKAFVGELGA